MASAVLVGKDGQAVIFFEDAQGVGPGVAAGDEAEAVASACFENPGVEVFVAQGLIKCCIFAGAEAVCKAWQHFPAAEVRGECDDRALVVEKLLCVKMRVETDMAAILFGGEPGDFDYRDGVVEEVAPDTEFFCGCGQASEGDTPVFVQKFAEGCGQTKKKGGQHCRGYPDRWKWQMFQSADCDS